MTQPSNPYGRRPGCREGVVRAGGRTAVVAGTATPVAAGVSSRQTNKQIARQEEDAAAQQAAYDQGRADSQTARAASPEARAGEDSMAQTPETRRHESPGVAQRRRFRGCQGQSAGQLKIEGRIHAV
jgi:hypothetical protein